MKRIKINKDKYINIDNKITSYLNPDNIYIPINNKKILKSINDKVYKGDEVLEGIYSPISGKVSKITADTLIIANDFRELNKNNNSKIEITSENILKVFENNQEKELLAKFNNKTSFDNIIINCINDNPYVYNKIFLLRENIKVILEVINKLSTIYNCKNNLLVIKNDESSLIDECFNIIDVYPNIKIALTSDEYLLEREEYLLEKLNIKKNYLYLDVEKIIHIYNLFNNQFEDTKLITISCNALKENKVLMVKKYTSLKDILLKFIKINAKKCNIIVNGLMTGYKLDLTSDLYITDDISSINIMKKEIISNNSCIKCGKCIKVCPKKVNPILKKNINNCIDCGLCTYICPVHINLRKYLMGDIDE